MLKEKTIAFLGAGSMAEAMFAGMVNAGTLLPEQIIVTNRSNLEKRKKHQSKYGVQVMETKQLPFNEIDVFVLAMKPKDANEALASLQKTVRPDQLILSVIAGISTPYMEEFFPESQQVIRAMPNTSAAIGQSATALSAGKYASEENINVAKELLGTIGSVFDIEEQQMDVFTGMAGSGPAYFYALMEHIEKAGIEAGFDAQTVRAIGGQTMLGAAELILRQEFTPAQLREKVTSPNGTTQAGLTALAHFGGGEALYEAIQSAAKRSKEISSELTKKLEHV